MPNKVQFRANYPANVVATCDVNKGSRKMMQAERGIRQHGDSVELELVRRNWTACTDAARTSHSEEGLMENGYDFGLITCPGHA